MGYYINMENDVDNEIPYNPLNLHLISSKDVEEILKKYNLSYRVNDVSLFRAAFTHKSYVMKPCWTQEQLKKKKESFDTPIIEIQNKSYEDLEFFGDSVLDFVTVTYITKRFENQSEGFYTKLKSKIVSGVSLAKIAKNLNFHKFILISQSLEDKNGRHSDKILEDVFEAFIGALYKDSVKEVNVGDCKSLQGFDVCYSFIYNMLDNVNDDFDYAKLQLYDTNYKDQLLKYYHSQKLGFPQYVEISVEENITNKIFSIGILNPSGKEKYLSEGIGTTKKKAEQQASKNALRKLGILLEE